jgi:hypothetical protein
MRTLDEMVAAGKKKLSDKAADMVANWSAAKARMKEGYGLTPFGPKTKESFNRGIDRGVHRVDPEKWGRNFRYGASK